MVFNLIVFIYVHSWTLHHLHATRVVSPAPHKRRSVTSSIIRQHLQQMLEWASGLNTALLLSHAKWI